MTYENKLKYYQDKFLPLIHKQVEKVIGQGNYLYYEVWIDLDENFEHWFDYMLKFPYLAAYSLSRWLIRRDKWYWSPSYIKELDKEISSTENPAEAFSNVLTKSLKK